MVGGAILSRMTAVNWSRDGGHQDDQQHPLTLWPVRNLIDAVDGAACPPVSGCDLRTWYLLMVRCIDDGLSEWD